MAADGGSGTGGYVPGTGADPSGKGGDPPGTGATPPGKGAGIPGTGAEPPAAGKVADGGLAELRGRVSRVLSLDGLTGRARILVDPGTGLPVEASGPLGLPVPGETALLTGRYARAVAAPPPPAAAAAPRMHFLAEGCVLLPPRDGEGLASFLLAGYIDGLDAAAARALAGTLGGGLLTALAEAPERLAGIEGLSPEAREKVVDSARAFLELKGLAAALAPAGLGAAVAARLRALLGRDVPGILRADPWIVPLAAPEIGASLSRALADSQGIAKGSRARVRGEILAALRGLRAAGETAVPERALAALALPAMPGAAREDRSASFRTGLAALLAGGEVMAGPTERPDDPAARDLFLPDSLAEVRTAGARLAALSAARPPEGCPQAPQACARAEALCGFPLDPGQREALAAVVGGRAALITGPRGAGKRLLAALLYRLFRERGLPACLASADGRGAEALAEAARAPARPLAALLEYSPGAGGFLRGPRNPLPAGLLAVTGAESLDAGLLSRILSAAPTGTTLALFGETGRAPPPRAACDPAETVDAGGAGLPAWLAGLAGLRRGLPGPAQPGRRRGSGAAVGLLRHVRLSGAYAPPGSQLLEALASLGRGEAPPGSPGPDGDFFYLLGEDEGALAAKVVRLMADRIPRKLGLPPGDASVALAGAGEGPLGARALSEALHGALGTPAAAPGCPTPPPLVLGGRAFRPGGRVLQSANAPELGLALGDRGTVLTAGPGALTVRVAFGGRELRLGPGDLTRLLPAWALPAASAPAWASFPAAVVTIGKGAERELDRAGLRRAASLAGRLLVIAGHPLVYGRILGSRGGGRPAPGRR